MIVLGINDSSHDAAISLVKDNEILFAAHSERYSKDKNTFTLHPSLIEECLNFGTPDLIAYFEKRALKRFRRFLYGGLNGAYEHLYRKKFDLLASIPEVQLSHHYSHASAGYFTSQFDDACIVVIDAIGEFETATIWTASNKQLKKVYQQKYPLSFGLFYSAFTQLVGLTPARDEYILMGMAPYGDSDKYYPAVAELFPKFDAQKINFHQGVRHLFPSDLSFEEKANIASAVQRVFSERLIEFHAFAKRLTKQKNLVYMGGCALNCSSNTSLFNIWDDIWIMPNPGDAGSSLGASLGVSKTRINNFTPYLGHNIPGNYPVELAINELQQVGVVGIASGRAEFGPRALGNRSLLADPRLPNSKSLVNEIKNRQQFRPFAPVVLEEFAHNWFEIDRPSPYMQFTYKCLKPNEIPSVVHVDGTSRVQTVNKNQHRGLYSILSHWHKLTGIPILLNTSLNIKDHPLLNDDSDVKTWNETSDKIRIVLKD